MNTLTTLAPPPDTICFQRVLWINVFGGLPGYSLVRTCIYIILVLGNCGRLKGLVDKAVAG